MFGIDDMLIRKELDIPVMEYLVLMSVLSRICIHETDYPFIAERLAIPRQTVVMWIRNLIDRGLLEYDDKGLVWLTKKAHEIIYWEQS